jgi:lysophospholipase L1-like esterase
VSIRFSFQCVAALTAALSSFATASQAAPFELRDGDRVVLIGGTFVERMQRHGYLESQLLTTNRDKSITFRNIGWSGDNVWGESRGLFGLEAQGFGRLIKDVKEAQPTVLFICYGANEAHAGKAGLPRFTAGLMQLLDAVAETEARIVLLSPYAYEAGHDNLPDPTAYNRVLRQYCDAIQEVASRRNACYVPLFDLINAAASSEPGSDELLTSNGLHLTETGYRLAARVIAERLNAKFALGKGSASPAEADRLARLHDAIRLKNELYFHRYRPQNETYLFLFRKHEQGNNAVEIPQFDPLVEEQEKLIAELIGTGKKN